MAFGKNMWWAAVLAIIVQGITYMYFGYYGYNSLMVKGEFSNGYTRLNVSKNFMTHISIDIFYKNESVYTYALSRPKSNLDAIWPFES